MRATLSALLFLVSTSASAVCSLTSFSPREYPVRALDVHDVDGDGNLDLLGMNAIAYGRADGTFEPVVSLGLASGQYVSRALDINGDGRDDILFFMNPYPYTRYDYSVLPNNGDRTFGAPVFLVSNSAGTAFGDLTNDGRTDVMIAEGSSTLTMINEGGFRFRQQRSPVALKGGVVTDADGDGNADIVAYNNYRLLVQRGDGNGGFLGSYEFGRPLTSNPWSLKLSDVNGDQKPDLIVTYFRPEHGVAVYYAPFRDTATPAMEISHQNAAAAAGGDFDGNGFPDLAVVDMFQTTIYLNDGRGNFNAAQIIGMTEYDTRIAAADVNRDGVLDLVLPDSYVASAIVFGIGDGTFRIGTTLRAAGEGSNSQVVTSGDFDGDGVDELISASSSEGLFAGHQVGPYTYDFEKLPLTEPVVLAYLTRRIAIGDVDHDSRPELVVADGTKVGVFSRKDGKWTTLLSRLTGTEVISVAVVDQRIAFIGKDGYLRTMTLDGNWSTVAPLSYAYTIHAADLDGDGREDLVIASGAIYAVYARGDGLFEPPLKIYEGVVFASSPLDMVTGDFNGDRNADIAFTTEGTVSLLKGNGNRTFTAIPNVIQREPTSLTARDVDGDGITDLAVNDDQHYRYYGVLVSYSPLFYGLSLYRGTSNGFVQTGSWFAGSSWFHPPVIARLRRGAVPALLSARWAPGAAAVVEFTCGTRRQTVRH